MNSMLSDIFFDATLLFLVIGSVIAMVFGLSLLFITEPTLRLNSKISNRISMRKATKSIETPIKVETWFYRHAKITGLVLMIGAAYVLHYLIFGFSNKAMLPYLPKLLSTTTWEWLLQAGCLFFLITCSFILIFGLLVFIRPSQLKRFEEKANHWVSTRQAFKGMSSDIDHANRLVNRHPKIFGGVVVVVSLLVLISLLPKVW